MFSSFATYYGIDWLAMTMTFLSLYLLRNKRKEGFLFGLIANLSWFTFGIMASSVANAIENVIFATMNINGYLTWRKDEQTS